MNTQEYKTGSSSSPKKNNNNNNNHNNHNNNNRNNVSQSPTLSPPVSPASISSSVGIVEVMLVEGRNLVSKNKSADVYVRMKIGDGFFHWSKSNTAKTTRPTWNYFIVLKVRPKQSRILHLRVNEVNFFAPDETLGECRLNLDELPPNETREMCVGLFPSSSSNGTKKGELFFKVSYYPNGKPLPARDSKAALPMQLLSIEQFKYPSSNPPAHEATNKKSESHAPSKPLEQIQAEQLYNKAMEEMSKFVEYARLAKKPADGSSAMSDIENSMVPAALKTASQLLFESLKLHRSGKSFAMLAFIFFQFDSLELTSKYLGYAEQLEPTFPVISRLRKLLVDSGCEREALDAKTPTDRLSVVVVGAKGLPLTTSGTVCCRLIVGYPEISKDTGYAPLSTSQDPNTQGTVNWETFFDAALSKATERYHFGHQNLVVQLFEKTEETGTIIGECSPIDLFSVERDCVHDHWLPLTNGKGSVRVVFNYQMGFLTPEEYPPLLYSALLSRDHPMVSSLMKRNPNLDQIFRDTNSHTTPSEIEPKNSTLLTKAARFGNIRMLKELIEFGASINGVDLDGFTPIMRAVQFDGVHDNKRAIRYLYDLGADLSIKNSKSFDIFAYCQSVEMRQFLKERTQMSMYKVAVVICPSCRYVQFPRCTEFKAPCVQSVGCSCEILACPNCSFQLSEEHRKVWLASLREIQYSAQAFTPNLPEVIDHYLFQCRKCMSFGFPGTFTPTGSELTTATDTAVVGTADNSFDKTEYSLKDAETMWTLLYHEACCSMHSSAYQLVRVKLSRTEVNSLVSLAANSTSFWDAPQPSVTEKPSQTFTLDQLPYEILQQIVGYLLCEDIAVCENVSHKLRESCDEGFWKSLAKRDFAVKKRRSASSEEEPETWKENYLFYTKLFSWVKELFFEENFLPRRTNFITDNGQVEVHLRLNGKKYLFNLDGMPFTFEEEFVLVASFSAPGEVTSLKLIAQGQSAANSIQLCGVLTVPPQSKTTSAALLANLQEHQQQNGKVTLTLAMEQSAIKKWVGPYLNLHIPGFYAFLMLKDNVGGSVILDIFYYTLQDYVLEK